MNLGDLTSCTAQWLAGEGPMSDIVISSRARLARNVEGMPFLSRCSPAQRVELAQTLAQTLLRVGLAGEALYVDVDATGPLERQLLVERHLISRQLAEAAGPRGVAISPDQALAVMVNEEDHLRLQALRGGLALEKCYTQLRKLDETLEGELSFAFHSRFGYLTACPTNVGTGLRVSVMLHLPGLKMSGEIEKVLRAARDMHLAVRGLYGEGTEAVGDLFQVSNQTTLGKSEEQIIAEFKDQILPAFVEYERRARQMLLKARRLALEDKVHRAWALLRSARMMSSEEALFLLSQVRLGLALKMLDGANALAVNELCLLTQPAHLQRLHGKELDANQRGELRAMLIRQKLGEGHGEGGRS